MYSYEEIRESAPPAVRDAMAECERRGLRFCYEFGTKNAVDTAARMDIAEKQGELEVWMKSRGFASRIRERA